MKKLLVMGLMLCLPQLAMARVYMCVDPVSGETSFTDKACEVAGVREEVRVAPTNLDSGQNYVAPESRKTWRSQQDTRKTGLDYNAERRALYQNSATASSK